MSDVPNVLFVCVHGSGRSIAARVLMEHYAEGRVNARAAGTEAAEVLNKSIVKVLNERGFDTSREFPKHPEFDVVRYQDVIVTMGSAGALPPYPEKRWIDWEVEEALGRSVAECRAIVDDLDDRVQALLQEIA